MRKAQANCTLFNDKAASRRANRTKTTTMRDLRLSHGDVKIRQAGICWWINAKTRFNMCR
jgi:hypothetical protein